MTVDVCNADENFSLIQCNTSVLASNCSIDDLAWVQCTLGSELKNKSVFVRCEWGIHCRAHFVIFCIMSNVVPGLTLVAQLVEYKNTYVGYEQG